MWVSVSKMGKAWTQFSSTIQIQSTIRTLLVKAQSLLKAFNSCLLGLLGYTNTSYTLGEKMKIYEVTTKKPLDCNEGRKWEKHSKSLMKIKFSEKNCLLKRQVSFKSSRLYSHLFMTLTLCRQEWNFYPRFTITQCKIFPNFPLISLFEKKYMIQFWSSRVFWTAAILFA